jgi:hypothetical protein
MYNTLSKKEKKNDTHKIVFFIHIQSCNKKKRVRVSVVISFFPSMYSCCADYVFGSS